MTTDPGDLVLDPTCGSGTTAFAAEQWGRRWITIDTSRVALALARTRIMGARYPYYLLADSPEGQLKEAEISRRALPEKSTYGNVRQGFVYERVPHITLRDIANNSEIDVIHEKFQEEMEPLRKGLNEFFEVEWEEWEIPHETDESWTEHVQALHRQWWNLRISRQKEIDKSIAAQADFEYLYDKPYEVKNKVRVAGPFTVESLSPHRLLVSGDVDEPIATPKDEHSKNGQQYEGTAPDRDFASMIIENLRTSGGPAVKQGRQDRVQLHRWLAWRIHLCGRRVHRRGIAKESRHLRRTGVRDGGTARPHRSGPGSGTGRIRRACILRLQLRRTRH